MSQESRVGVKTAVMSGGESHISDGVPVRTTAFGS